MKPERHVLLVGASRGIGAALAAAMPEAGWTVTATVRRNGATVPGAARVEIVDIDDDASVHALAGRLFGQRFDLVFVNAGVFPGEASTPIHELSPDAAISAFRTNALAPLRFVEAFVDRIAPGGLVALMSSTLGSVARNTNGGSDAYRASKAALNTLGRCFAVRHPELGVLLVHPGWVRTDMTGGEGHLDTTQSASGIVRMLASRAGTRGAVFVDWENRELPW